LQSEKILRFECEALKRSRFFQVSLGFRNVHIKEEKEEEASMIQVTVCGKVLPPK
jgi:hypothetical protein